MLRTLRKFRRLPKVFSQEVYSAKFDPFSLGRSELIRELCKSHTAVHPDINDNSESIICTWASKFVAIAHLLENYMLFQHYEAEKIVLQRFRSVNPDIQNVASVDTSTARKEQNFQESSFLTQFAYILKQAGYEEVPQTTIEQRLKFNQEERHIKVKALHENYVFLRYWVIGRKEIDAESKKVFHERVIIASQSHGSSNMILKGFKDISVYHFESLLPEARVQVPRLRRWLISIFLSVTGVAAFFNVVVTVLTDYNVHYLPIVFALSGFIAFRTSVKDKSETNKYILAWKSMLYYKSTANNAGLVLESINRAHERSLKEVLLVYGTALRLSHNSQVVTEQQITEAACKWLSTVNKSTIEYEDLNFGSSFCLLQRLGLMLLHSQDSAAGHLQYRVLQPEDAAAILLRVVQHIASC